MIGLKLCSNGGMKLDATGLALGCCDPCELAISRERNRINAIPRLVSVEEYPEGLLVYDDERHECRAAFYYSYYASEGDSFPAYVLEYFDCETCEKIVLYNGGGGMPITYRHYPLPDICNGCVIKMDEATLLATIDESGPDESGNVDPIKHLVFEYTNSTYEIQYIYWIEGGDETPINAIIDNWAVLDKNGVDNLRDDLYHALLYPNDTVKLYCVNQSNPDGSFYNPWELHCKVYMAQVACDPCEVAVYKAMHDSPDEVLRVTYGPGFSSGTPYQKAFIMSYNTFTQRLYGVTCDTCEIVLLDSWDGPIGEHDIPYTEDESACDGEGEVQ